MVAARKGNMHGDCKEADPAWSQYEHHQAKQHHDLCFCITLGTDSYTENWTLPCRSCTYMVELPHLR